MSEGHAYNHAWALASRPTYLLRQGQAARVVRDFVPEPIWRGLNVCDLTAHEIRTFATSATFSLG